MNDNAPSPEALERIGPIRAAAFWLERLHADAPDSNDREAAFADWLRASEANRCAWDDAVDMWDSLDGAGDDGALETMRRDALRLNPRRLWGRLAGYAIAVSIAAILGITVLLRFDRPVAEQAARADLHALGVPDYATRIGESMTVTLEDGTRVTLDTDSAIDIAYVPGQRLARLVRGQAFFAVRRDAARPFRVAAGRRIVSVLGTSFNVKLSHGETRVLLVEGAIAISRGSDPAVVSPQIERLAPGQLLVARPGKADRITDVDIGPGLGWRQGFVQFDGDRLDAVVEELNRYTRTPLVIRDPSVAALRVSGAFPTAQTDRFVETLEAMYPVRAVPAPDGRIAIERRR